MTRAPGQQRPVTLTWHAGRQRAAGRTGLLLLASAAQPGRQLWVAAAGREMAGAAAPLPPLLPRLQQRHLPRPWWALMAGVDWKANATWLLYVPFSQPQQPGPSSTQGSSNATLSVTLGGAGSESNAGGSGGTEGGGSTAQPLLVAQALPSHPLQAPAPLLPPGQELLLPQGHPGLLLLQPPGHVLFPPTGGGGGASTRTGGGSTSSRACLRSLLVGSRPPWSLQVAQAGPCSGGAPLEGSPRQQGLLEYLQPAVLAVHAGLWDDTPHYCTNGSSSESSSSSCAVLEEGSRGRTRGSIDSVRLAGPSAGRRGVPLWELGPPAGGHLLLLVSDPRCPYSLR